MPPKRKRAETTNEDHSNLVYAGEVAWLRCLTHGFEQQESCNDAEGDTNTKIFTDACKLAYILYHDIEAHGCLALLLQSLNKTTNASKGRITRAIKIKQSSWKRHILHKFFLPHVKELQRKWEIAHPYARFSSLPHQDRIQLWMDVYDANPKGTVTAMLKPVVETLDINSVFRLGLTGDDHSKMKAMRFELRQKYWFGCDCTYKHSIIAGKNIDTLNDWVAYAKLSNIAPNIPAFANLPVSSKILAISTPVKKEKTSTAPEDGFESFFAHSTNHKSGSPTDSFPDMLPMADEQYRFGRLPISRTTPPLSDCSPVTEKHHISAESIAGSTSGFNFLVPPSSSARWTSQDSKKSTNIAPLFFSPYLDSSTSPMPSKAGSSLVAKKTMIDDDLL